jgi:hypothetical protein
MLEPDDLRLIQPACNSIGLGRIYGTIPAARDEQQSGIEMRQVVVQGGQVPRSHHREHGLEMRLATKQGLVKLDAVGVEHGPGATDNAFDSATIGSAPRE